MDEFIWTLKCLGELFTSLVKDKKIIRSDMFYVQSSIYSKLAESFASNECKKSRMKSKIKEEKIEEQEDDFQLLSRRDQRNLTNRFETLFSEPSIDIHHLYDLITNTRLEFFHWIYRPLMAIFGQVSQSLIDQKPAGKSDNLDKSMDHCLLFAIRFKKYYDEIYLNEKILNEICARFIDESSSR